MKNQKGQSLFEVVVALAISTVIIVALVSLASVSIRNAAFSRNKTISSRYVQETTEWLRSQRDENSAAFITNAQGTWCMPSLSWDTTLHRACLVDEVIPQTQFSRSVTFTTSTVVVSGVDKTLINAEVLVSWEDSQGIHDVRSSTDFSDWRQR